MANITGTAHFILARTGCSCCSSENRLLGPFQTLATARERRDSLHRIKYLASQYASNGIYELGTAPFERLADGRLILGGRLIADGFADDSDRYCDEELGHPDALDLDLHWLPGESKR